MSRAGAHSTVEGRASGNPHCQQDASLLQKYLKVRDTSLEICAPLGVEDHNLQPNPDASPAKWHLAHTTWFFETFVLSQYME
jgi:hypothetical protein